VLFVSGKVLSLAVLRKLGNSWANATSLACLWATLKPWVNMASLRPSALSWMRLSVLLARLSLDAVTALLLPLPTHHPLQVLQMTPPLA
jgi:hypothetical protein